MVLTKAQEKVLDRIQNVGITITRQDEIGGDYDEETLAFHKEARLPIRKSVLIISCFNDEPENRGTIANAKYYGNLTIGPNGKISNGKVTMYLYSSHSEKKNIKELSTFIIYMHGKKDKYGNY